MLEHIYLLCRPDSTDLVAGLREQKKGQRTLAIKITRAAGPKPFLSFSPSKKRFAFLRRPQITPEAFSMMGEACYGPTNITQGMSVKTVLFQLRIELNDATIQSK